MLKRAIYSAFLVFALSSVVVLAQTPGEKGEDKFKTLASKLKSGDTNIDFKALRMSTVDSNEKDAGARSDTESYKKAVVAMRDKKYKLAISEAERSLTEGYLDPSTHVLLAVAHQESGNKAKHEFHKAVYLGLINSILDGADGKSAKTAYIVIDVNEEYAVLDALALSRGNQGLRAVDGHKYDVLTVTDPKTKQTQEVWFNIDIVWKGYDKLFK